MSTTYDVIVIGSGTAGQTAAFELNQNGLNVGLVEHSERPGGTCALSGCQAKKWFYEGAEIVARSRHLSGIGLSSSAEANWQDLRDAKNRFTAQVPSNTVHSFDKAGIDFIRGRARFVDRSSIAVNHSPLSARFFIVATGAVPMTLPIEGAHLMLSSDEFLELDRLPRRIVFIGGGFISFELAHFAARLGPAETQCIILEAASRPLGPFDEEMVSLLSKASAAEGIDIRCDVKINAIEKKDQGFVVITEKQGQFETDLVVNGAGRVPDINALDLDHADIKSTSRGIIVDEQMMTSTPNVYAVGDCAATIQLARVADAEAQVAAVNILGREKGESSPEATMDYRVVPTVLFSYPQYGMVGSTEDKLANEGVSYKKSFGKDISWPTYKRVGLTSAAFKLLADQDGQLLGAHILSDNASGLVTLFTLAMINRIPVTELYQQTVMTPYPSRESDIIYMLKPLIR